MKLPVVVYPDKRLKLVSDSIEDFNADLHIFLEDMYDTMMQSNGIGLAAIQVAKPIRVLLLCMPDEEGEQSRNELLEIINPKVSNEEGTIVYQEGCLSVPSFYEDIERYEKLTLDYQDRHGKAMRIEAEGLLSVAIQHEIDHLDGKLFIEKLPYGRRKKFEKEYKKLLKSKKSSAE